MANFKYFNLKEFDCKCGCGKNNISLDLVSLLNDARKLSGIPFKINSGCRCESHNKIIGGKKDSSHLSGFAVDISCNNSRDRFLIEKSLLDVGFNRIGEGETFIHVDIDFSKSAKVKWRY